MHTYCKFTYVKNMYTNVKGEHNKSWLTLRIF